MYDVASCWVDDLAETPDQLIAEWKRQMAEGIFLERDDNQNKQTSKKYGSADNKFKHFW